MKRSFTITALLTLITATIGIVLWTNGYPPEKASLSETRTQLREIVTFPLFWAAFGAILSALFIWLKRHRLAEAAGKASRIPAVGVQLPALFALLFQILIPLKLYEMIGTNGSQTIFFYFLSIVFFTIGNFIVTAPFRSKIGFRTPATLSDQMIWTRVHRALGRGLVVIAILTLPLPWLLTDGFTAQWVLIGIVASFKATIWLYARRLAAQSKLRNALPQ